MKLIPFELPIACDESNDALTNGCTVCTAKLGGSTYASHMLTVFPQFVYKQLGHSENNQSTFRYKGVRTFSVAMAHASQSRMYCIHVLNQMFVNLPDQLHNYVSCCFRFLD